jgi:hypothetical protein
MIVPMRAGGGGPNKMTAKQAWSTSNEKDVLYTEYWANTALGLRVSGWPDVTWLAKQSPQYIQTGSGQCLLIFRHTHV